MARSAPGSLSDRQTGRGPLSRLAGARARTLAALVYAASEATPAARAPSSASAKPQPRATELDECEEVARSLLVARGDGAKPLESMEKDLDQIALPIERAVQPMLLLPLGLRVNHGFHASAAHGMYEVVRVVAGIPNQSLAMCVGKQLLGGHHLVPLARRQRDVERTRFRIDDGV